MHWSISHVEFLRSVVPELAHVPLYLLNASESGGEWQPHWMAAFSPLADLRAQTAIETHGLWNGRGAAIIVRNDFATWSNRCKAGTLLHELSHAIEYLTSPDALVDAADLSPVARELLDGNESEILHNEGIDRNALVREQHGQNFVRLSMHLYWRARQQAVLSPSDLQFMHEIYSIGADRYDAVAESLASELAMSWNLNLLRLREAPAAFLRLFR